MMQRRKGTIQRNRINNKLLDPEFQIDERTFDDLLAYIVSYVEHINYYTTENVIDGNWKNLVEQDPVIYIIGIIKEPIESLHQEEKLPIEVIQILLDWYIKIEAWYHTLLHFKELVLADKIRNVLLDVLHEKKEVLQNIINFHSNETTTNDAINLISSYIDAHENDEEFDLAETAHTFRKMVLYIQNFTREHLSVNLFNKKNHMPNNAMYIAFSILFQKIQAEINNLSQRHLDFYYKDVLQQTPSKGIPTKTVVCFELTQKSKGTLIPENTPLIAGKLFESKKNILFETTKPLLAVSLEIATLQTFYLNRSPFIKVGTNTPTIANIIKNTLISNAKANEIGNNSLFGANESTIIDSEIASETITDIGFMIGSQVLFLEEGEREIIITFKLDKVTSENTLWKLLHEMKTNQNLPLDVIFNMVFEEAFTISYTTSKQWEEVSSYYVQFDEIANTLNISFKVHNTAPAIAPLASEKDYTWPMVKVLLSEYAPIYAYSFFKGLQIELITIDVNVTGIKDLAVHNNLGKVSLSKPFHLFGNSPEVGNYLLIGKSELYKKELSEIDIQIEWDAIPTNSGGFDTYYKEYSKEFTNSSFLIETTALSNGYWFPRKQIEKEQTTLFSTIPFITPEGYDSVQLAEERTITLKNLDKYQLDRDFSLKDPLIYTVNTNSGFLKLTFSAPEAGFGKEIYRKDYAAIASDNAKNNTSNPLPNKPFVPKVKQLSLNYSARDYIYFNNAFDATSYAVLGDFIHITPFGLERVVRDNKVYKDTIVSNFEGEGYLYIKLTKIQGDSTISLFFDLNNTNPEYCEYTDNVVLEYKKIDRWIQLPKKNIISDGTDQLSKSGIIEVLLPSYRTEIINETFELRFVAKNEAYKYPTINGIYPNAVEASCTSDDATVIGKKVPAGSIIKTTKKIPELKKVNQPQDSYNGKLPTPETLFYTEVSERLRHKDRALTIWDYEHLVLQYFHEVVAVKCTNLDQNFKPKAGRITLVVLSNLWKHDNHHYFNTNELSAIHQFIKSKANSFIKIKVQNPTIESLLVTAIVTFETNDQGGYYINALNDEFNKYLCPISHENSTTVAGIGGTVVPRMLRSHIENLPYIQSVQKLEIEHIVKKGLDDFSLNIYEENAEIKPTKPWSMLVPKTKHNIYSSLILQDETIEEIERQNFRIGVDYIIAGDNDNIQEISEADLTASEEENTELKSSTEPTSQEATPDDDKPKSNTILNFRIK